MKVDEVIKSAISRAAVVRVQNALNPLLWVLAIAAAHLLDCRIHVSR